MFERSNIPEAKVVIAGTRNLGVSGQQTPAPTLLDTPRQSTQRVQFALLKPERRESPDVTTQNQDQATINVPNVVPGQNTRARRTNRSVRFAENLPRYRGSGSEGDGARFRDQYRAWRRVGDRRRRSRTPAASRRITDNGRDVENVADAGPSDERTMDTDDDNYGDVIMEENPLENYPRMDESSLFSKLHIDTPVQAGLSLLTEQLLSHAATAEANGDFSVEIQKLLRSQATLSELQIMELQSLKAVGEKTKIRVHRKEGVPEWGFEVPENGGADSSTISRSETPVWLPGEAPSKP